MTLTGGRAMDDQLRARLVGYLDRADAFASGEIPEAVREWLLWLAIERFAAGATYLVVGVAAGLLACLCTRYCRTGGVMDQPCPPCVIGQAVLYPIALLCLLNGGYWTLQGVKVVAAPRAVVVEELAGLSRR